MTTNIALGECTHSGNAPIVSIVVHVYANYDGYHDLHGRVLVIWSDMPNAPLPAWGIHLLKVDTDIYT